MNIYQGAALGVVVVVGIVGCGNPASESRVDRKDASTTSTTDEYLCDDLTGNAKDICVQQSEGQQRVAEAEFAALEKSTEENDYDLSMARADAEYDVAKQRCQDVAGNDRDVCIKEADRAYADAKAGARLTHVINDTNESAEETIADAREEAADTISDSEYGVAREKCDAFAGDVKDECIEQAKAEFAQN